MIAANANVDQSGMSHALISQILNNPAVSYWLKDAFHAAMKRDPVDALRDAELLVEMLKVKVDECLNGPAPRT